MSDFDPNLPSPLSFQRKSVKRQNEDAFNYTDSDSVKTVHTGESVQWYELPPTPSVLHLDTAPDEYSLSEANLSSGREYPSTVNDRAESRPKSFYRNPFREIDMSSFPAELRQRLQELPVPTQIAILRDAKLQQKFFPEYCHPV